MDFAFSCKAEFALYFYLIILYLYIYSILLPVSSLDIRAA